MLSEADKALMERIWAEDAEKFPRSFYGSLARLLDAARAESQSELLEALKAVKHGAEYPDELGDIIDAAISRAEGLGVEGGLKEGIAVSQSKPVFASNGDPQARLSDGKGAG